MENGKQKCKMFPSCVTVKNFWCDTIPSSALFHIQSFSPTSIATIWNTNFKGIISVFFTNYHHLLVLNV